MLYDVQHALLPGHTNVVQHLEVNCTYLRPAPVGAKVFVESWVVHLGKRMGQTAGVMRLDSEDGKVCYTCEHGKAAVGGSSL
jgi:acyl-coenzyme A thioesterase 13